MEKKLITYGTFDLFHIGHLNLLKRLSAISDRLIVGVSTDEFNESKGKKTVIPFEDRIEIIRSIKGVDTVLPENSWDQKVDDIIQHNVNIFAMGDDWTGKFDFLQKHCEVLYLPRTQGISTTQLKGALSKNIKNIKDELTDLNRNISLAFDDK